jgi:hypothetical protein
VLECFLFQKYLLFTFKTQLKSSLYAVVGIVTGCSNGVTNYQLFFLFKAITTYTCSGSSVKIRSLKKKFRSVSKLQKLQSDNTFRALQVTFFSHEYLQK